MRNAVILGCGRSGTSMVAGLAASAGYFMGPDLHEPRAANPKGFFEGEAVRGINEAILDPVVTRRWAGPFGALVRSRPRFGSRWLALVPPGAHIASTPSLDAGMRALIRQGPFAFKDPRFCYTLPAWRPQLPGDMAFVCVFREPGRTVNSILKECREAPWLQDLRMSQKRAVAIWLSMYRHVVEHHSSEGDWLFLHYDQVLDGDGVERLAAHLGAPLEGSFVDPRLKRSPDRAVGDAAMALYERLCGLAEWKS